MPRDFKKLNAELGGEFDRYVIEHPAGHKSISCKKQKSLSKLRGDVAFNAWSRRLAERARAPDQPVVLVCIKKLSPVRSRIIKADVLRAA